MADPDRRWLYHRVHVSGLDEIRDLLEQVVRPTVAELRGEDPGLRWFFLQYQDHTGLQLRVRVHAPADRAVAWHRRWLAAWREALARFPADRPGAALRTVVARQYEPEPVKFGGAAGVELAEWIAQRGSDAALAVASPRQRSARVAYGAAHTALATAWLPPERRRCLLHQYAWYWSNRGDPSIRQSLPAVASPAHDPASVARSARLVTAAGAALADAEHGPVLRAYAADLARAVSERSRRQHVVEVFDHLHLMNNRLGIVPLEEAQIARLLWVADTAGASVVAAA